MTNDDMHIQEIGENVLMAFDTLRTHKIRSALTMLGVIGGTMTVIAISSFLTGLREFVLEQTKRFGPDLVFVSKWDNIGIRFSRPSQSERMRKNLTVDDAKALAELPSVSGVSPTMVVGSFAPMATQPGVKYRGIEANRPIIFGVWSNYDVVRNVYIKTGRFFTADEAFKANVINRLAPKGQVMPIAMELARAVASNPPLSVRATVRIRRWQLLKIEDESSMMTAPDKLHLTEDFREAALANREKRKPRAFKGR